MRRVSCIVIMSIVVATSGCVADPSEDQEGGPDVSIVESEIVNPVRLEIITYNGYRYTWWIINRSDLGSPPARRAPVFLNGTVGTVGACHSVDPGNYFLNSTVGKPSYLIGC